MKELNTDKVTKFLKRREETRAKHGTRDSIKLRKFQLGELYVGKRMGTSGHLNIGVLVDAYVTVNHCYRNPAYVLKCLEDGKERVYQGIEKVEGAARIKRIQKQRKEYLKMWHGIDISYK